MTVGQIIGTGLTRALGTGLIADLAWGNTAAGALKCLKDHFTLDGRDLAAAFQDSLSRGAGAIALGLSSEGAGVLTRLGQGARRALSPNLARAYAAAVERDFLLPYGAASGLSADRPRGLRRRTLDACRLSGPHVQDRERAERAEGAGGPAPRCPRPRPQESKASALAVLQG